MRRQHLRCALVGKQQELVFSPAAQLLGGPQPAGQRMLQLGQHGGAGLYAVGPAQFMRLVDHDPQNPERRTSAHQVLELRLQPFFHLRLAGFDRGVIAGLAVRQGIQPLGGMKNGDGAKPSSQPIAQEHGARHGLLRVADLVAQQNQRSAGCQRDAA